MGFDRNHVMWRKQSSTFGPEGFDFQVEGLSET